MRLWSISPSYLDSKGLVALWREGLLAQNVLAGNTRGYKNHPQLNRFKETSNPLGAIATYLRVVAIEADSRGYQFDKSKIMNKHYRSKIPVSSGQIEYEFEHLLRKLNTRDPKRYQSLKQARKIITHPLFRKIKRNKIEDWEVV